MRFVVEYYVNTPRPGWKRYGQANSPRLAEVLIKNAKREYPAVVTRVRRES